jgi:hypothetical protein
MAKLLLLLKSRTAWTVVVMFLVSGVAGVRDLLPADSLPLIDGILAILALYFRANAKSV